MLSTDKKEFSTELKKLMAVFGKPADPDIFSVWFNVLNKYELSEIKAAFTKYVENEKYPPVPASVIDYIPRARSISADEAWAHVPKSEYQAAWLNNRMVSALAQSQELIDSGDMIAARMTFKAAYDNLQDDSNWYYSEAYGVPFEQKSVQKVSDYKLLENRGWLQKNEKIDQLAIANGSDKTQKGLNKSTVSKLRSITNEMPCLSQKECT